jgi:hypothetical protein
MSVDVRIDNFGNLDVTRAVLMDQYARFWAEVWAAVQYSLTQLIFGVATDEKYARDAYGAWSATARLGIVAKLAHLGLPSELFIAMPPPETQERGQ